LKIYNSKKLYKVFFSNLIKLINNLNDKKSNPEENECPRPPLGEISVPGFPQVNPFGPFFPFRSKVNQNENQPLLKIQGVNDKPDTRFYLGKRVAYIYKASGEQKYRAIWGRISRAHGDNGVVVARFAHNLPPRAIGATCRVMLYPNRA
jgi:large subunit ribosomal protein L35Ae